MRRVLRMRIFLGSTVEEVEKALLVFLIAENICVGNYIDTKFFKLGNAYQLILVYAEVVQ